jgi:two-component system, chemotaxis family, protein-glutamate methylesterase/glutaminase
MGPAVDKKRHEHADQKDPSTNNFPVVCIGGSAGSQDAYVKLLKHLPPDLGFAVIIVNHIKLTPAMLHNIIPRHTKMPVDLITEGLRIQANHVFIMPSNREVHVLDGEFRLRPISKTTG